MNSMGFSHHWVKKAVGFWFWAHSIRLTKYSVIRIRQLGHQPTTIMWITSQFRWLNYKEHRELHSNRCRIEYLVEIIMQSHATLGKTEYGFGQFKHTIKCATMAFIKSSRPVWTMSKMFETRNWTGPSWNLATRFALEWAQNRRCYIVSLLVYYHWKQI